MMPGRATGKDRCVVDTSYCTPVSFTYRADYFFLAGPFIAQAAPLVLSGRNVLFELADVAELLLPGRDEPPTLLLASGVPTPQLGCLLYDLDSDGKHFRNPLNCLGALIVTALNEPQNLGA